MAAFDTEKKPRFQRESRTIRAMIGIYCRAHHGSRGALCAACRGLLDYAFARLERCRFGEEKPPCARCPVHCYEPAMRERIRIVMRYAGPRMLLRHPILALQHQFDGVRHKKPPKK